jgi:flagellar protein FliO/FliZ
VKIKDSKQVAVRKTMNRFTRINRNSRFTALCLALLNTLPAAAQTAQTAQTASSAAQSANDAAASPSVLPMLIVLIFVLLLIPVAMWMLKKIGAGMPSASTGLRVVGQLPVGPRELIVIVEAGDRWLLLGVTAASINRVGTLPKGELPAAQTPPAFATLLAKFNKSSGGSA